MPWWKGRLCSRIPSREEHKILSADINTVSTKSRYYLLPCLLVVINSVRTDLLLQCPVVAHGLHLKLLTFSIQLPRNFVRSHIYTTIFSIFQIKPTFFSNSNYFTLTLLEQIQQFTWFPPSIFNYNYIDLHCFQSLILIIARYDRLG
jgi:hypothetical protein